jgi:hypothetical protein
MTPCDVENSGPTFPRTTAAVARVHGTLGKGVVYAMMHLRQLGPGQTMY